jgi:hypothetical protein
MAKHIDDADKDEPRAIGIRSGGRLARKYEYILFYAFAIGSWGCMIAAGVIGSIKGGDDHRFVATVTPFLVLHW